ncbi:MAG: hypothetical protein ACLRO0_10750, partial [Massilimicrobiota timonensis]
VTRDLLFPADCIGKRMWINLMRAYLKYINNRQMVQNRKYTSGFINTERSSYTSAADKSFFIGKTA